MVFQAWVMGEGTVKYLESVPYGGIVGEISP
jgi:hypothetical protein